MERPAEEPFALPLTADGRTVHVHGTATQVEFEEANPQNSADYRGWGTLVTSYNQLVWLHVSLPVDVDWREVVLSGKEVDSLAVTTEVGAEYDLSTMEIGGVHLWDGGQRFAYWDRGTPQPSDLLIGHDWLRWKVNHRVQRSLGLSIAVLYSMGIDSEIPPQTFTLTSAHAIFE